MIIKRDIPLSNYSTYRIGGPAKYFCEVRNEDDLREALLFAKGKRLESLFLLGGGSNLIISDDGFSGLIIKIQDSRFKIQDSRVEVGVGFSMHELITRTSMAGLQGLEWAGGLPGSLGGAVFGNAGAFGGEMKDVIHSVYAGKIINYKLGMRNYTNAECGFTYRSSIFKREGDYIILSATLAFKKGDPEELMMIAKEKQEYRKNRHPLEYPNIGSIFKNINEPEKITIILEKFPEFKKGMQKTWHGKIPTAALIQRAGLQGKQQGGAQISEKHANFIVNRGNATAADVVTLIKEIKETITSQFGIELEEEVRYVGL